MFVSVCMTTSSPQEKIIIIPALRPGEAAIGVHHAECPKCKIQPHYRIPYCDVKADLLKLVMCGRCHETIAQACCQCIFCGGHPTGLYRVTTPWRAKPVSY